MRVDAWPEPRQHTVWAPKFLIIANQSSRTPTGHSHLNYLRFGRSRAPRIHYIFSIFTLRRNFAPSLAFAFHNWPISGKCYEVISTPRANKNTEKRCNWKHYQRFRFRRRFLIIASESNAKFLFSNVFFCSLGSFKIGEAAQPWCFPMIRPLRAKNERFNAAMMR